LYENFEPVGQLHWGPPRLLYSRYWGFISLGVKQLGHEADHSPTSSVKVKNAWSYTTIPPYIFMISNGYIFMA
jgi:hypothetical protein